MIPPLYIHSRSPRTRWAIILFLISMLAVASCNGVDPVPTDDTPDPDTDVTVTPEEDERQEGGSLIVALPDEPNSLNFTLTTTLGDLDLLVTCEEGSDVMARLVAYEEVERVVSKGQTRSTVFLRSGLQVDLRVVPEQSYGAALHYFTGSKEHNVALREDAVRRGLSVSEYGVEDVETLEILSDSQLMDDIRASLREIAAGETYSVSGPRR
jgi:hypothetical protein